MAGKAVDPKILAQEKKSKLTTYAEKIKQQISSEKNAEKKAFFQRDLKKTLAKIETLG